MVLKKQNIKTKTKSKFLGKTEATRIFLQYLVQVSHHSHSEKIELDNHSQPLLTLIERQVMEANVLLESFGNAKTIRNNNSSRFGKFIQILFDTQNKTAIIGARMTTYLLEKSRVAYQESQERNFHVFYEFVSGASEDQRNRFCLNQPFQILSADCMTIPDVDDSANFNRLCQAMTTLQIPVTEQTGCFQVIATILHLGNIQFVNESNNTSETVAAIANSEVLDRVAKYFQLESSHVRGALCTRTIHPPGQAPIQVKLTVEQARQARDILSKTIYGLLFQWIVSRINNIITPPNIGELADSMNFIGLLDIFGFEIFQHNGFEQLCINVSYYYYKLGRF